MRFVLPLFFTIIACQAREGQVAEANFSIKTSPKFEIKQPPLDSQWQVLLRDFDRFLDDAVRRGEVPGMSVAIVKDSNLVFCKGYGLRVAGGRDSVDANTVFRIGSLSKGFAGVLTGIVAQEGRVRLDDPVTKHFPEFALNDKAQARRTQVEHLLSHTTGLPYHAYTNLIEAGWDIRKIAAMFPRLKLSAREGKQYSYQNAVFSVVAEVLRTATGQSYADLLAEKIFRPAGMATASADYASMLQNPNKALPHNPTQWGGWQSADISPTYYNAAPAGGVNASAADMGAWLRVLLGFRPEIVPNSTLDAVFEPRIRSWSERRYFPAWPGPKEAHYALGWRVLRQGERTYICHGGSVNGFTADIAFDRERKVGICLLFNAASPLSNTCSAQFFEFFNAF